jgi:hypothetical protein
MTRAEKIELGLIAATGVGLSVFASARPPQVELGNLVLYASALLLLQSLLRDIWLLIKARSATPGSSRRVARCMCAESTVGITGIAIGTALVGFGLGKPIVMSAWTWGVQAVLVLMIGFLIKDYVVESGPWRIRRDSDHVNILVRWRA